MSGSTNTVMRAVDFISTIGVNTHISDPTSSYASSDVLAQMQYLGIVNMRVSDYSGTELSLYDSLGAAGIKFDAITVIAPQNPINLANEMSYLNLIAPYVVSVEGPNEVNTDPVTYNGLTGAAAAEAFQADLYNAVKADPALAGVNILPFSLSVGGSLTGFGNVSAYATEANVHGYAGQGVPPYYMLSYAVSSVTTVTNEPVVMSETGYYTLLDGNSGVTQDVQAKWLMDTLLQNAADGISNTYLYQLEDGGTSSTDPEDNYGLFTANGTAKQSAIDIHNLTTILADPGASAGTFTTGTLNYNIAGLNPDYGFHSVFEKSNGAYDIALWSEPQFFNAATGVAATVTPSTVTITLGGGPYNINVYDPVIGTGVVDGITDATSIVVSVTTDPLIIEVTPYGAPATGTPGGSSSTPGGSPGTASGSAGPVVLGSGAQTLALFMAEDAYQGDAEFTVAINGVQVGGVQTVTALHNAGASEEFDVLGNYATGSNQVTVTFVNDLYGGSPSLDRNLYVDSATINGQTIAGSTFAIDWDTSQTLSFAGNGSGTTTTGSTTTGSTTTGTTTTGTTTTGGAATTGAGAVVLGSGSQTLALFMAEDAYQGDAQFTVSVDGTQVGGTQTVTAIHGAGASEEFDVLGNFTAGSHVVTVNFLNDDYGGSPSLDRNLYVDSATINGQTISGSTLAADYNGPVSFNFIDSAASGTASGGTASTGTTSTGTTSTGTTSTGTTSTGTTSGGTTVTGTTGTGTTTSSAPTVVLGSGADTLALSVSEDYYLGNAQFTISVDGKKIGGTQTALAIHGQGAEQIFDVLGNYSAGKHTLTVDFLNDSYGGAPSLDRNLYVDSATLNGVAIAGGKATAFGDGSQSFTFIGTGH